jgi:hypothetical protein
MNFRRDLMASQGWASLGYSSQDATIMAATAGRSVILNPSGGRAICIKARNSIDGQIQVFIRLLITFLLCEGGVLYKPVLYLSHDFKRFQAAPTDLLRAVTIHSR